MPVDPDLYARLERFLPLDILNNLPDAQALTGGIRRLNSLHQAISSFLPQYIAENEELLTGDHGQLRPGTFMFADVSGFTALSEQLQRQGGAEGTDILTEIINHFFATMLEILAKSNGELLKFAGDALLAFFPARAGIDEAPHAIRTGLRMQRAMQASFQPIRHKALDTLFEQHHLELSMSIGVSQGNLFEALVGNMVQRDLVIQGDLPGRAMAAEEAGERDDVIIDLALKDTYSDTFDTETTREPGFFRVLDNFGDALSDYEFVVPRRRRAQSAAIFDLLAENLLDDLVRQLERVETIARFVAAEVVNQLALKGDVIEAQNRPATVIFTYFAGFDRLLTEWGTDKLDLIVSILDRYYSAMQETVAANGGSITRSDPYKQGVKLLITFGAPVAYSDDPERAVTTSLEMHRRLAQLNAALQDELPPDLQREVYIQQRFGITHGMVFATEAGWRARREYTVMGDDVNLAARLMGTGEMGQILISERAWERVREHFDTEALAPFQLKGKSAPTQAYLVKASIASVQNMSPTSTTPFVGRDMQLLMLTYALQQAKGPRRRQGFALQGEPGVGKTRMAKHVSAAAQATRFKVAWANCQIRHGNVQGVWAALIAQLLELEQAKSEEGQRRLLNARLDDLGLSDLEGALSQLIFGSFDQVIQRRSPQPAAAPVPKPAMSPRKRLEKSGVKGLASLLMDDNAPADTAEPDSPEPIAATTQDGASAPTQADTLISQIPDSIVRFLQTYADRTATLLVLDDIHVAAPTVWSILSRVVSDIKKARLVILVTHEPGTEFAQKMPRKINVTDLDEDETRQMIARVLNVRQTSPGLFQVIWNRTSGRPLFIESLIRLLQNDGYVVTGGRSAELKGDIPSSALPDNVRELIISQFDRLSGPARLLLQAASVSGDGFRLDEAMAVSEDDNLTQQETALGELLYQQVLDLHTDGTYRFRHGVTQTTVYDTLNRLQRQKMHRAAAAYWQSQPSSTGQLINVVHHLAKAGTPEKGLKQLHAAVDRAEQAHDHGQAITLITQALDIVPNDAVLQNRLHALLEDQPGQDISRRV